MYALLIPPGQLFDIFVFSFSFSFLFLERKHTYISLGGTPELGKSERVGEKSVTVTVKCSMLNQCLSTSEMDVFRITVMYEMRGLGLG